MGFLYLMLILGSLIQNVTFWIVIGAIVIWYIVSLTVKAKLTGKPKEIFKAICLIVDIFLIICLILILIITILLCFIPIPMM